MNRRGFITGFASCIGAVSVSKVLGAEELASVMKADLVFGVLSDVHLLDPGDEDTLLEAFRYFDRCKVDGVVIAGDIADRGKREQLQRCAACWKQVFPGDKGSDGRHVEKLFVYGNHDVDGWGWGASEAERNEPAYRAQRIVPETRAEVWEETFGEPFVPVWMKTVKGYTFVGAHWPAIKDAPAFLRDNAAKLAGTRPFFYIQHAHPKNTCFGAWAWGRDDGASTKALSEFPNAVAFSGHSHYTLTDERSVWQGAFTSFNTASLRYASTDYSLRENIKLNGHGSRGEGRKHAMYQIDTKTGRQGMVVRVYGSTLVVERRDFVRGASLGPDWTLSIPGGPESSFAARAAKRSAPEFAADAKIAVELTEAQVKLGFPAARTVDGCRVSEYEVTATLVEDDVDLVQAQRRMMAPDFFKPETPEGEAAEFVFNRAELPLKGHYVFTVRPLECFGRKGRPLATAVTEL